MNLKLAQSTNQFRYLAERRLKEATALLRAEHWSGALYISGYVVECALKAVLAKKHGGLLPKRLETHDLTILQSSVADILTAEELVTVQSVPPWSHLQRYCTTSPSAGAVLKFHNLAREAYRCLTNWL
jgi:HEPN domain-containing protein